MEKANAPSLLDWWRGLGVDEAEIVRALRTFNAQAEAFRQESERREPH
jgi:hypothetical protein